LTKDTRMKKSRRKKHRINQSKLQHEVMKMKRTKLQWKRFLNETKMIRTKR
jgi:hypothetical protein